MSPVFFLKQGIWPRPYSLFLIEGEECGMANFQIFTNNPLASEEYPDFTVYRDTTAEGILLACRDAVHKGAVLINHPLSGSVKPNISPYKSLVTSLERQQLDFVSLRLIEDALTVLKGLRKKSACYSDEVLADFQVIDLDLLHSAMIALPHAYHA